MTLAQLNPLFDFGLRVLRAFVPAPMLEEDPTDDLRAEVDDLIQELAERRAAHRPTRKTHARLRAARIEQLKYEVRHARH